MVRVPTGVVTSSCSGRNVSAAATDSGKSAKTIPGSAEGSFGSSWVVEPALSLVSASSQEHAVSAKTATRARAAVDLLRAGGMVMVHPSQILFHATLSE